MDAVALGDFGREAILFCRMFHLEKQTAIVIGGTGTLGGAMAAALASAGARVAILGRNAERGNQCVQQIADQGGEAFFMSADSSDNGSLERVADAISKAGSVPTILVNAAGGNRPEATLPPGADFCSLPLAAWRDVFDLNLVAGTLMPCQVFGKRMLEAGQGSIINIASMSGIIPLSRVVAYSASKAAVINLTKFLAREWATRGVRVNAISPGFFPAEQNRPLLYNDDGSLTQRAQQILSHTPMNRFGRPEELAGAVVWLASHQASSFVTGQNIVVDGGFSSSTI